MPSAVLEAASITPEMGLMTNPPIPLAVPSKKPGSPFFSAPCTGCVITPVIAFLKPKKMLLAPFAKPSSKC